MLPRYWWASRRIIACSSGVLEQVKHRPPFRSEVGRPGRLGLIGIERYTAEWANRWQRQFFHQPAGLRACLFRLHAAVLLLVPIEKRLQDASPVRLHVVESIVIEGRIEISFRPLEVAHLRVCFTESLCN